MRILEKLRILMTALFGTLPAVAACPSDFTQMVDSMDSRSLPLVNLTVDVSLMGSSHFTSGRIEIADPQKRMGDSVTVALDCLLRYRGASALGAEKKSFAVKLVTADGGKANVGLLGMREENSWILDAMAFDCMRMRNRACFDLWNLFSRVPYDTDYGRRNGTEGQFVEVFLNGDYHGLYCLSDKVDRRLLGLKKSKSDDDGGVTLRGLLYKCVDTGYPADLLLEYGNYPMDSTRWDAWELQYPDDYPSEAAWQPLAQLIDFCAYRKTTNEEFVRRLDEWFYEDNIIDYFIFCNALLLHDNIKNRFLSTPDITAGHRYLVTPWDMDISLGFSPIDSLDGTTANLHWLQVMAPYARISDNEHYDFYRRVSSRWEELRRGPLSPDSVMGRLDCYAQLLETSGAWQREREKWDGNPRRLAESPEEWLPEIREWYERNTKAVTYQLNVATTVVPVVNNAFQKCTFDLQGRLTQKPTKGVYIQDGKKVVVK